MLHLVTPDIDDLPTEPLELRVPLFSMKGTYVGPRLVVTGPAAQMRDLADRFWDVPGFSRMRGSLVLRPDGQDPSYDTPDAVLRLKADVSVDDAYFQVLGRMTALGMISGRGVPRRWVA